MRRLVYHVSVTQDGFIAGPGGEFDFFVMNDDLAETLNVRFPETIPTDLRGAVGIGSDRPMRRSAKGRSLADPNAAAARRRTHRRATAPASEIDPLGVLTDLANASATVTGGAGGFGSATTRRLAQKGSKVVIADVADEARRGAGQGDRLRLLFEASLGLPKSRLFRPETPRGRRVRPLPGSLPTQSSPTPSDRSRNDVVIRLHATSARKRRQFLCSTLCES